MNWRKSTRSNSQGACVEVGSGSALVGVRDTKDPRRLVTLEFAPGTWTAFLGTLR